MECSIELLHHATLRWLGCSTKSSLPRSTRFYLSLHLLIPLLQGEVEQISLMKPKAQTPNDEGMLEYLEDIIGSSRLKAPIAKVERRLDTLQQQRSGQLVRYVFKR